MKTSYIQEQLNQLKDLLNPLIENASPQKKRYANAIMEKIISEINKREIDIQRLEAKLSGFYDRDEYLTQLDKFISILILIEAGDVQLRTIQDKTLKWLLSHNDSQQRPMTFIEVYRSCRAIEVYKALEEKLPESMAEIKEYFTNNHFDKDWSNDRC